MFKRGQVTIFIIVGIIIIGIALSYFVFREDIGIKEDIPANVEPIYSTIQSCLEETSREGIDYISSHGGYYFPPYESSVNYLDNDFPIYYIDSALIFPDLNTVEEELEYYISWNLEDCNLDKFIEQGFDISTNDYNTSIRIVKSYVGIEIISPITIQKEDLNFQLKRLKIKIYSNLYALYESSKEIVESYAERPGEICLTCLDEISKKNNVSIEVIYSENNSTVSENFIWFFIAENNNSKINSNLTWVFVVENE